MAAPTASSLPPSQLHQDEAPGLYALFTVFLVLPLVAVALRVTARRMAHTPLWWDDWLLIAALVGVVAQYVFLVEAIHNGEGQHAQVVPQNEISTYLIWTYASEIYYAVDVTLVKSSVLCLYLRLFGVKRGFARLCYGLLVFVGAWGIATVLTTILQCLPVAGAWDMAVHSDPATRCINLRAWLIANNVPNILADVVIILLPMPLLWRLQLSVPRRLALTVIFLLAFATTIISILRVNANANINVLDPTWSYVGIAQYSTIEANTGILTASLPVLAPLVRTLFGRRATDTSDQYYDGSRSRSRPASHPHFSRRSKFSFPGDEADADDDDKLVGQAKTPPEAGADADADTDDNTIPLGRIHVRHELSLEHEDLAHNRENNTAGATQSGAYVVPWQEDSHAPRDSEV